MASPAKSHTGRRASKRGPGQRLVDGARFRLADEVRYIQRRAADHDGRVVIIGQLMLFPVKPAMPGSSIATITSRSASPVAATPNRSISKKPTLPLQSTGRGATASKAQPSSTPTATPAAPQPSSAIQSTRSLRQDERKNFKYVWLDLSVVGPISWKDALAQPAQLPLPTLRAPAQKSGFSAVGTAEYVPGCHWGFSAQTSSNHSSKARRNVTVADQGVVKAPLSSTVSSICSPLSL
jgi:hypothetical protein